MADSSNILPIDTISPAAISNEIAVRVKARRLELLLTQEELSKQSGVNIETYRRFERTGEVSLRNLLRLAIVLDATSEFNTLFAHRKYQTLADVVKERETKRKRGKKIWSNSIL